MKILKAIALSALMALLVSVSACIASQPQPESLSSMPLYPGAKEATDPVALEDLRMFNESFNRGAAADQVQNVQTKMYLIGNSTTWDQVDKFYTAELEKRKWELADPPGSTIGDLKRWRSSIQFFVVGSVTPPTSPELRIIVLLASFK
jgi:hypothetical protein